MQVVAREDIEDGPPLLWEQVPAYVTLYPSLRPHPSQTLESESEPLIQQLQPEFNRRGKRVVYVEHAITGELTPVFFDDPREVDYEEIEDDIAHKDETEIESLLHHSQSAARPPIDFPTQVAVYLRVIFLLVQGVLAGFSFTTAYIQNAVIESIFLLLTRPILRLPLSTRRQTS